MMHPDDIVRMNEIQYRQPVTAQQGAAVRAKYVGRVDVSTGEIVIRHKPDTKLIQVTTIGVPQGDPMRGARELEASIRANPIMTMWKEVDRDGDENFRIDREAGLMRYRGGGLTRREAWLDCARCGVTLEEFERAFGKPPEGFEGYEVKIEERYPDEPEWVKMSDGYEEIWLSKEPIRIENPYRWREKKTLLFFLGIEIMDMGEACGEPAVTGEVFAVAHWETLHPAKRREILKEREGGRYRPGERGLRGDIRHIRRANDVEGYRYLAEDTARYGMKARMEGLTDEWDEEEEEKEGFNLEARKADLLGRIRAKTDWENALDVTLNSRQNQIGNDGWDFCFGQIGWWQERGTGMTVKQWLEKGHMIR